MGILSVIFMGICAAIKDFCVYIGKGFVAIGKWVNSLFKKRNEKKVKITNDKKNKDFQNEQIIKINEVIEEFFTNKQLLTICKKYVKNNNAPLWFLEFCFFPTTSTFAFVYEKTSNLETKYLKHIEQFDEDFINQRRFLVSMAYYLKNKDYESAKNLSHYFDDYGNLLNSYIEIENLFLSIIHQNIINSKDFDIEYYAFMFVIYYLGKIDIYKESIKRLEEINLTTKDEKNLIVSTLYNYDYDNETIVTTLFALENEIRDKSCLICKEYKVIEEQVRNILLDIKEKETISKLLEETNGNEIEKFTIADIDLMSGAEFENFVTYMFNQLGYKATNTKLSGDQGIDVIATKGKTTIAIQCKCFHGSVGNHAIMEAFAGAKYYNADKCMVVTNSLFTKSARELANKNGVVLWDRQVLKEKLEEI